MNSPTTRRAFLATAATLGAAAAVSAAPALGATPPKLVHHVFFWLKNPDSKEDLAQLLAGIRGLAAIETVRGIHVGVPASTEKREVVDNSFSASEILYFDDVAGQNAYQVHPLHQKFVAECSHLWAKVIVYDALAV
ncbi:Stress responsive A/B Barrel Domain protein [Lacunisphaera limnophila]|uniref:Stress responsive A/B Barrel Domain protein n=1 Tax=Lacunisphaera limnophila TaxID=1838286 RepID=A0A1D8AU03_9BACT|nr:Dabb family protein [Lacunisphaera limnophila]AOS44367.1 Stress responsive A/B Barrel Domain protein [Lacunisphaera limnophila]